MADNLSAKSQYLDIMIYLYRLNTIYQKPLSMQKLKQYAEYNPTVVNGLRKLGLLETVDHNKNIQYSTLGLKFCHKFFKEETKEHRSAIYNALFGHIIFSAGMWSMIYVLATPLIFKLLSNYFYMPQKMQMTISALCVPLFLLLTCIINDINYNNDQFFFDDLVNFLKNNLNEHDYTSVKSVLNSSDFKSALFTKYVENPLAQPILRA